MRACISRCVFAAGCSLERLGVPGVMFFMEKGGSARFLSEVDGGDAPGERVKGGVCEAGFFHESGEF